ncbi:uncharacterized protein LOC141622090 isoform X3 [Silene latifolia]|uniref:uncharacterized protein LOC141622090 isoform X3 n=1 Tax=Silene latifolia TaxID=37657 RepID=UPI003D77FFD2
MATSLVKLRSGVQSALRHGRSSNLLKRSFSSSAHHDEAYEAKEADKWEKITYLGIVSCTALAVWNLSKGIPIHAHPQQGVPMGS